jgi:hypothetical protein
VLVYLSLIALFTLSSDGGDPTVRLLLGALGCWIPSLPGSMQQQLICIVANSGLLGDMMYGSRSMLFYYVIWCMLALLFYFMLAVLCAVVHTGRMMALSFCFVVY